jgi:hypothetical protein
MRHPTIALSLVLLLAASSAQAASTSGASAWTVKGQEIQLNGAKFFAKGVVYSPTPIGGSADYAPFQDWFGSQNRYDQIWKRDVPEIRAMGANLIRTYAWWAYLPTKGVEWPGAPNNVKLNAQGLLDWSTASGIDHTAFLDALWNGGKDPIYVLIGIAIDKGNTWTNRNPDPNAGRDAYYSFYLNTAKWAASKYGQHPAVMGFILGNEMNDATLLADTAFFWPKLNAMADAVKSAAHGKLVTVAWQNDEKIYTKRSDGAPWYPEAYDNKHFDFWGVNVYGDFTPFWKNYQAYVDSGSGRPVLLSEWGAPCGKHTPPDKPGPPNGTAVVTEDVGRNMDVAAFLAKQWTDIAAHDDLCSGGTVFSWTDEWWKVPPNDFDGGRSGKSDPPRTWLHDASSGRAGELAGGWWEEEWWGLNFVSVKDGRDPAKVTDGAGNLISADVLTKRAGYKALKGLWTKGAYSVPRPIVDAAASRLFAALPTGPAEVLAAFRAGAHRDALVEALAADRVTLEIRLDPGSFEGTPAEWFLVHVGPAGMRQYDADDGSWKTVSTLKPSLTAPLGALADVSIPVGTLAPGTHCFIFAVDLEINTVADNGHWLVDAEVVVQR